MSSLKECMKEYRILKNKQHEAIKRKHIDYALSLNGKLAYLSRNIDKNAEIVQILRWRN